MNIWAPHSLRRLAIDPRIGPRALRVYAFIVEDLDLEEYRPVKLLPVARELGLKPYNTSRAMRLLVDRGYLDRNGRAWPGGPYRYRLIRFIDDSPPVALPRLD